MMNRFASNRKRLVFHLGWLALGAAALSGIGESTPAWSKGAEAYSRRLTATKDQLALEAYEKRNAEITANSDDSVPTITDNAALLYYQACLLVPEPNGTLKRKIRPNTGPSKPIRAYLGHCLPAIEMVEAASRIPDCSWAAWPGGGKNWAGWSKLNLFGKVLLLDATTLAVDGHYRVALERCLMVRQISQHLGDDPELPYAPFFDILPLYTIKILLHMMPPDAATLTWFGDQLSKGPWPGPIFAKEWRWSVKIEVDEMTRYPIFLRLLRDEASSQVKGRQAREAIQNLTDGQVCSRAAEAFSQFNDAILRIVSSGADYHETLSQVHELCDQLIADASTDPVAKAYVATELRNQAKVFYEQQVEREAHVNGTRAAVGIYLVLAKTGRLPEELPDHLPKDPFTGKDFGYEITDEGFALRCAGEDFKERKKSLLEFEVRR